MDTLKVRSHGNFRAAGVAFGVVLVLLLAAVITWTTLGQNTGGTVLTQNQFQPLVDVSAARIVIDPGDGNLTVDTVTADETILANASLQYLENQGLPIWSLETSDDQTVLSLKANTGGTQPWIRLPWQACNGATDWLVHLNPAVVTDVDVQSDGGNISLDLTGMHIRSVSADTGGGNVTVVIGGGQTGTSTVQASSGAGNVEVHVPKGTAVRVHATTGLGQIIVDSRFTKEDDNTYQTNDFESATDRIEITLESGAGNASVVTR